MPLYFCWGCVNDIAYQIIDDNTIKIHPGKRREGPSFPYEPFPEFFERRGLSLHHGDPTRIRSLIRKMAARWDATEDSEEIPVPEANEQVELTEFFGHPVPLTMCAFHHQFGGKPIRQQWAQEVFSCPNPACTGHLTDRMCGRKRAMKFLAGILNDPWAGLPMVEPANERSKRQWNYFVSVQFHVCDCCWTVLACNRSD